VAQQILIALDDVRGGVQTNDVTFQTTYSLVWLCNRAVILNNGIAYYISRLKIVRNIERVKLSDPQYKGVALMTNYWYFYSLYIT